MKGNDDGLRSALLVGALGVAAVWAVRSGLFDSLLGRGRREMHVLVETDLASHTLRMEREPPPAMEGVPLM
jgi:nitrogen fixation-related uncharacterized protein